eukprot:1158621_1
MTSQSFHRFRWIYFVALALIVHSQRVFDSITLVDRDRVHIDFWDNNQWNRYKADQPTGYVYYETGVSSRNQYYTFKFIEQGNAMQFESTQFSGSYLGVSNVGGSYYLSLITANVNTFGEWLPSTNSDGAFLESTYGTTGCLHIDNGTRLQIDPSCTQSHKIRIVQRFPCYDSDYFDNCWMVFRIKSRVRRWAIERRLILAKHDEYRK